MGKALGHVRVDVDQHACIPKVVPKTIVICKLENT
jgi:hypothetical protein